MTNPQPRHAWVDGGQPGATPITAEWLNEMEGDIAEALTAITANAQTSTAYTLALDDAGKAVEMNNAAANALTVPPNAAVALPIGAVVEVVQVGAGQTTITAGSGVTLRTAASLTTRTQWATVSLRKRGADEWVVTGDLA